MARRTALASSAVSQPAPRSLIAHRQVPRAEAGSMASKSGTIPCGPARHTAYVAIFPSTGPAEFGYAYVGMLSPASTIGPLASSFATRQARTGLPAPPAARPPAAPSRDRESVGSG